MTANGFKVVDSDMHIFEPPDLWQRYIEPEFRHAAPVGLNEMPRDMRVRVQSTILLRGGPALEAQRLSVQAAERQHGH